MTDTFSDLVEIRRSNSPTYFGITFILFTFLDRNINEKIRALIYMNYVAIVEIIWSLSPSDSEGCSQKAYVSRALL